MIRIQPNEGIYMKINNKVGDRDGQGLGHAWAWSAYLPHASPAALVPHHPSPSSPAFPADLPCPTVP